MEALDADTLKKSSLTMAGLVSVFPKISDNVIAQAKEVWPATDAHLELIRDAEEGDGDLALALLILIAKLGEIAVDIHAKEMRK